MFLVNNVANNAQTQAFSSQNIYKFEASKRYANKDKSNINIEPIIGKDQNNEIKNEVVLEPYTFEVQNISVFDKPNTTKDFVEPIEYLPHESPDVILRARAEIIKYFGSDEFNIVITYSVPIHEKHLKDSDYTESIVVNDKLLQPNQFKKLAYSYYFPEDYEGAKDNNGFNFFSYPDYPNVKWDKFKFHHILISSRTLGIKFQDFDNLVLTVGINESENIPRSIMVKKHNNKPSLISKEFIKNKASIKIPYYYSFDFDYYSNPETKVKRRVGYLNNELTSFNIDNKSTTNKLFNLKSTQDDYPFKKATEAVIKSAVVYHNIYGAFHRNQSTPNYGILAMKSTAFETLGNIGVYRENINNIFESRMAEFNFYSNDRLVYDATSKQMVKGHADKAGLKISPAFSGKYWNDVIFYYQPSKDAEPYLINFSNSYSIEKPILDPQNGMVQLNYKVNDAKLDHNNNGIVALNDKFISLNEEDIKRLLTFKISNYNELETYRVNNE
ncbi:MHO_1580 family protein [Mycoplasmopsis opalescens]|uniref:MHO_1580 family protein n=1 Tax=Mycoplasmopsis opalescens TaxID=114886 RepID=UPI0004A70F9C|nr:hypothetical protein [Mycoplasmopsis opalescens]